MAKIVLIGAGSWSFGSRTLSDLFAARAELAGSTLALVDINPAALELMARVAQRMNAATGDPFEIVASTERSEVLSGADFVIISVAVKRNELWRLDFDMPNRHGARQVLGENGGPGGLFHAMRNIPILLGICRDIERLCPEALVLNFTNPEGRLCLAASRYTKLRFVGLCHGIGMAQHVVAETLDLPIEEIDPKACGLNHFTWITDLRRASTGEDLYPAFKQQIRRNMHAIEQQVGWGLALSTYLMDVYGCWPSPSDDHIGEYISYAWEFCGQAGYDFAAADRGAVELSRRLRAVADGTEPVDDLLDATSGEYAIPIITAVLGNKHQHILAVNVPNTGLIANLPAGAIVEVPALVDASGVHGLPMGALPEPIAAMCRAQLAVIDRVVEAGVHGDRKAALAALLLDPVIQSAKQAEAILEEMLAVHKPYLPQFTT